MKIFLSKQQSPFNRPLDKYEIPTPIDVRERRVLITGIGFALSPLLFLVLNPFLAIFILSLYSLYVDNSVKQTKLVLLIFALSLAIFYASRDIWAMPGDDAAQYVKFYLRDQDVSLASIASRFFLYQPNNEVLYFSCMWVIGKLLNPGEQALLFIVYFGQLTLLSVAAYLVSRRYAVVFLFVFFLGITDPSPNFMSIWRATFAQLIFMIGTLIYFKGNPKTGRIIILASPGFHLTLILFIFIFELYIFVSRRTSYFKTLAIGGLAFYLSLGILRSALEYIWPGKAAQFYNYPEEHWVNLTEAFVLIVLFVGNYFYKLSPVARFATFSFLAYFLICQGYADTSSFAGRFNQMAWGLAAIPLFEMVMKQPKVLIAPLISLLLVRTMLKPVTEYFMQTLPQYRDVFYGVLNILGF